MAVLQSRGKLATSKFREIGSFIIEGGSRVSFVNCELETGRTHQLRVHLSHLGNPIVGDPGYGKKLKHLVDHRDINVLVRTFQRQALHATSLGFLHPIYREYVEFKAKPPEDFRNLLRYLVEITNSGTSFDGSDNVKYAFFLE